MQRIYNQHILVVMAHPDDIELSCFGLIKKLKSHGYKCTAVIATNGENGFDDSNSNTVNRKNEAENSLLGLIDKIIWLEMEDGNVKLDSRLNEALRQVITNLNPEIVVTHFPDETGIEHQDHYNVGKSTINVSIRYDSKLKCLLLAEPLFFYFSNFVPNCFVDITEEYESKIEALKKHKSQNEKFYMNDIFQFERATRFSLYGAKSNFNRTSKYELFHIFFEKII